MAWLDFEVEPDTRVYLWEILVPTEKRIKTPAPQPADCPSGGDDWTDALRRWKIRNSYSTRYHRVWDEKVRVLTGGLTILRPAVGQWTAPDGEMFKERMIPVRIAATRAQISRIIDLTLEYYDQLAVFCSKISDEVIIRHRKEST